MPPTNNKPAGASGTGAALYEQMVNTLPVVLAHRLDAGGAEAAAFAVVQVRAWTASDEAAFGLAISELAGQLAGGDDREVERVVEALSRSALLSRAAIRDGVVKQAVEPVLRQVEALRARATSRLRPDNARQFADEIVRRTAECVDSAADQIRSAVEETLRPERIRAGIDQATVGSTAPLAIVLAALQRIRGRLDGEEEVVDRHILESTQALDQERERLLVIAIEAGRSFFGRTRSVGELVNVVAVSVPKLGLERVSSIYLPAWRAGLPVLRRALDDAVERLHLRRPAVSDAVEALRAQARESSARDAATGRVVVVGVPATDGEREVEVTRVMSLARPSVARVIRDLAVAKAPSIAISDAVLGASRSAVAVHAPQRSLDDALLSGADRREVALRLDSIIQSTALPVSLTSNADRALHRQLRCLVMRVAAGSEIPALLAEHGAYWPESFCTGGPPDRMEVSVITAGISLSETAAFASTEAAFEDEVGDSAAPPVATLSDAALRGLVRKRNGESDSAADFAPPERA